MKKFFAVFLAVLFVFGSFGNVFAHQIPSSTTNIMSESDRDANIRFDFEYTSDKDGDLIFTVDTVSNVLPGDIIDVSVRIGGADYKAHCMRTKLHFDPLNVEVLSVTPGEVLYNRPWDAVPTLNYTSEPGIITCGVVCPTDPLTGQGVLFTASLHIKNNCTVNQVLTLEVLECWNWPNGSTGTEIPYGVVNGLIILYDDVTTPTPTAAPTEPDVTIAPVVTPEPTELTKAEDMFYENCYIADIWLNNNYDGYGSHNGSTAEYGYFNSILDQESLSEILVDKLDKNNSFKNKVDAWNGILTFFDPDKGLYECADQYQVYEAVIFDFITRIIEDEENTANNLIQDVLDSVDVLSSAEEDVTKVHKLINNIVKASGLTSGSALLEFLKTDSANPRFINEFEALCKDFDFLQKWKDSSIIESIGVIASVSNDISDFMGRMSSYFYLEDVSDELLSLLKTIRAESGDDCLRTALQRIITCIENTELIEFVLLDDFTANVINKTVISEFTKMIWTDLIPTGIGVIKLGYEGGRLMSNLMYNTEGVIDKYYLIKASAAFTSANRAAIDTLKDRYLESGTEDDAGAYIYAMRMYKYALENDLDAGAQFAEAAEKDGLINFIVDKMCKLLKMLTGDDSKSNYEYLIENKDSVLKSYEFMYERAETCWKYDYLKEDRPEVYPIYASDIFTDEHYIPQITDITINTNGEIVVTCNYPPTYYGSDNELEFIGANMIDGIEVLEIVNGEHTVLDMQLDETAVAFSSANNLNAFPKDYYARTYTESSEGRIYSEYCHKLFDPLKPAKLEVTKILENTVIGIHDKTLGKYTNVRYHIYRMNASGDYVQIDTIDRNSFSIFGTITPYYDGTASVGSNRYKVVSEMYFNNGSSLFAESAETIYSSRETEAIINDLIIRIVGSVLAGSKSAYSPADDDPGITEYGYELTWEPYENAEGYQIYRKEAFGENYNLIAEVDGSETTYLDSTADVLLGYEFMIIPYTIEDGVKTVDTGNYAVGVLTHTVTFVDWDGTVLSEQTVEHSHGAEAPEVPGREGYAFIGWDHNVGNIQDDVTITALYGPRYGDIDCSGLISMADVTILSMYLNGENPTVSEPGMLNADANADGTVDIRDIAAIYAIIAAS